MVAEYKALLWSESKGSVVDPKGSDLVESSRILGGVGKPLGADKAPKRPIPLGRGEGGSRGRGRGKGRSTGKGRKGKPKAAKPRKTKHPEEKKLKGTADLGEEY